MTTDETSTKPSDEPPVGSTQPEHEVEPAAADDAPESAKAGREASKYRHQLRETDAERDAERVAGFQRADAERLASTTLSRPADLWLDGATLADVTDDEGQVIPERVAAIVASVTADRPGLRPQIADHGGGRREPVGGSATTWGDVIAEAAK